MNRKPGQKSKYQKNSRHMVQLGVVILLATTLSACNLIKQVTGGSGQTASPNPNAIQTRSDFPAPGPGPKTAPPSNSTENQYPGRMAGYWKLAYKLDNSDETFASSIKLSQTGIHFNGQGTDDHNNKPFSIEQGTVQNGKVIFYKRYDNPSNTEQTPVEYEGTVDLSGNPYMTGKFIAALNGQELTGAWEAELDKPADGLSTPAPAQQAQTQPQQPQQPQQNVPAPPDHAPDLSGKWTVGFEYRFKEVQSTVWLEQDKGKLRGHGIDHNTKEKFEVEKGWYAFPKVTMIRKYPSAKLNKVVIPEHRMTFKGNVEWLTEKDYQGPYMRGKTDGGGNWEAQLVR